MLTFGIPTDYASMLLHSVYSAFQTDLPHIRLSVTCFRSRAIHRQIHKGKIDFAVVANEPLYWVASAALLIPIHCSVYNMLKQNIALYLPAPYGIAISLLPASSIHEDMHLLPENLLSCPFTLRVGCVWSSSLDTHTLQVIQNCLRNATMQVKNFSSAPAPLANL